MRGCTLLDLPDPVFFDFTQWLAERGPNRLRGRLAWFFQFKSSVFRAADRRLNIWISREIYRICIDLVTCLIKIERTVGTCRRLTLFRATEC